MSTAGDATKKKHVFVTSASYTGAEVGGLAGAHAKCQALADASNYSGGVYKAWLSTGSGNDPYIFMTVQSTDDYYKIDGSGGMIMVDFNWTGLTNGTISSPIDRDENGNLISDRYNVWTNTDTDATFYSSSNDCSDWTSDSGSARAGSTNETDFDWTSDGSQTCSVARHLYCFEQ